MRVSRTNNDALTEYHCPVEATLDAIGGKWKVVILFHLTFVHMIGKKLPCEGALPFVLSLVANLPFMPIFSGMRNVSLAAADFPIDWATIVGCVVAVGGTTVESLSLKGHTSFGCRLRLCCN